MEDQHGDVDASVDHALRPRMSTFSYDAIRKDREADVVEPGVTDGPLDTEVESPAIETPQPQLADVVRERAVVRRFKASERGIRPVFVPSLREDSTRLRLRADALQDQSPEHALQLWREYITLCPRDADAWFAFGQCALMSGLDRQAHRAFQMTIELDETYGLAEAALGFLVEKSGDLLAAKSHYERAVHLRPRCLDMLKELVRVTAALGQAEEAEALRDTLESMANSRSRG